ncbi:MAG: hypothetical protein Q7R22_017745 [Verrucomicrobiota bacterium JB025]|nr:hypothetical protein [Verrucomicrobiota bacterium JB025]
MHPRKPSRPRILITGFGPFSDRSLNGSESLARALHGEEVLGARVESRILDVIWGEPEQRLPGWIAELEPTLVIGLGEARGSELRFESRAVNHADGSDITGGPPPFKPELRPGAAHELFSTLRFDTAWLDGVAPATVSDDAGSFLCNNWLYTALETAAVPTGFIHLPIQGKSASDEFAARWKPALLHVIAANLQGR